MKVVDKYFKDKTDNLTFIELREKSFVELKGYIIEDHIPLPLLTSELIKGIKDGEYEEEIKIADIIKGVIYTLGSDPQFLYIDEYKEILRAYDEKIVDYIFFQAIKDLEEGRLDDGCIKLRALLVLEPRSTNIIFNYGLGIEGLAKNFIEMEDDRAEVFLNFSTGVFESTLEIDKEFALAHYKLGYHYLYSEMFLKASLTWKKFISLSSDELLVQEIRNEIENIEDDVIFETGLTYLAYKEYEKSLNSLLNLLAKYKDNWNLNFSIGRSYMGLEQYDLAIEYLKQAIELKGDNPDPYNELGIIYFNNRDVNMAIDTFSKGIDGSATPDAKLFFNRGMTYILIEEFEKALDDIKIAYDLDPNEDIKNQKEYLESLLDNPNNNG